MEKLPLRITFRHLNCSPALEQKIREKLDELARLCKDLLGCEVLLERAQHRHRQGDLFHARVTLKIRGGEVVASHGGADENPAHEDPYLAVRDAFDAARRQLEHRAPRQRPHPPVADAGSAMEPPGP